MAEITKRIGPSCADFGQQNYVLTNSDIFCRQKSPFHIHYLKPTTNIFLSIALGDMVKLFAIFLLR